MSTHIVQSPQWGKVKTALGTKAIRVGEVQYTKHKIPLIPFYYAYCPKVTPKNIDFNALRESLKKNNCISINFDVPNVLKTSPEAKTAIALFEKQSCVKAPKDTFAKYNILLDITKSEEELLTNMHTKHRYNTKYAQKRGVWIHRNNPEDFEVFYTLLKQTAERQHYYIHPKRYYEQIWLSLKPQGMCHTLTAKYQNKPLVSWMLFNYDGVLYYPYGGSTEEYKQLHASNLMGWEAIKLGKQLGCHTFDMWGACENLEDTKDPWWGFTNFKLKFGGKYVEHIDSYDLVLNKPLYKAFNLANEIRWKLLKAI